MLIIQSQNLHNFAGTIINIACGLLLIGDSVKIKKHRIAAVSFFKLVAPAGFEPATF